MNTTITRHFQVTYLPISPTFPGSPSFPGLPGGPTSPYVLK